METAQNFLEHFVLGVNHTDGWVWTCKVCFDFKYQCNNIKDERTTAQALQIHCRTEAHQTNTVLSALANEGKP